MALIIFPEPQGSEKSFSIGDEVVIGRDSACAVVIADESVSRRHAVIRGAGGRYVLEDLNSRNGTLVNGRRVSTATLVDGESIHFGDVFARFAAEDNKNTGLIEETVVAPRGAATGDADRLRFLYDLADMAAFMETEEKVAHAALKILLRQLDCDHAYLGLADAAAHTLNRGFHIHRDEDAGAVIASSSVTSRVLSERVGVLLRNVDEDRDLQDQSSIVKAGIRSVIAVPVMVAGKIEGVLYADTRERVRSFNGEDLAFAGAFASILGSMIGNFRIVARLREKNRDLQRRIEGPDLLGEHPRMNEVRRTIENYALKGHAPVLITGESGTGKDLAARMVHRHSSRADKPFLCVNCAAVPRDLIESELFGHLRGAFTGAVANRRGLFELADGGTLFLDEIGEMPFEVQAKLLRAIETGEFRPLGSEKPRRSNARLVMATNRDLRRMISEGAFRKDLYFRLNVLMVEMPPLREHSEDIPLLAEHFFSCLKENVSTSAKAISPAAIDALRRYAWPGNVRELRNVIERALYACETGEIGPEHLSEIDAPSPMRLEGGADASGGPANLNHRIEEMEREQILNALLRNGWNKTKAAAELGVARKTLIAKVKKYGLRSARP